MNVDTRIILEERLSRAEYPMDFCAMALDILEHGDRAWAEQVYLKAVKRARGLDDRAWILVDGLEKDLCPPAIRDDLIRFLETRTRPLDRLTAVDTFVSISDRPRATKYLTQWAKRARSVEFLTESAEKSWTHGLVDKEVMVGWLRRAQGLCRSQDDWYLVSKAWVRLGYVDEATLAADAYDDLSPDLDDLLITIELLRDLAPKHAADRCQKILDEGTDPFTSACMIKECVAVAPELVPKAVFKFLSQNGDCHDCLMIIHEAAQLLTSEMCKALINRAVRTADNGYDAADIVKAASTVGLVDISLAILDHFLAADRDIDSHLALLQAAIDTEATPLLVRVRDSVPTIIEQVTNTEQLIDCIGILRAIHDEEGIERLIMKAEFYVRGCWDWIGLLSVLNPLTSDFNAHHARRWVSRAALTTLDPDALSSLASYVRRHLKDGAWADHLASTSAVCKRGIQIIHRLMRAVGTWIDRGGLSNENAPDWPIEDQWDANLMGDFDVQSTAHHLVFLNQIKSHKKTLAAALDWVCKRGIYESEDHIEIISVVGRTMDQLTAIRFEVERMAVDVRDRTAANGSWNIQLSAALNRGQIHESIPLFVHRLTSQRDRMWVGD
jgi:hypothetical protein